MRSHETPLVKKRQVMNHAFGDYRLKMAEEQKNTEKAALKPGEAEVQPGSGQPSGSVMYKKHSDKISEAKPKQSMLSDSSSRLDFTPSEMDPAAPGTTLGAAPSTSDAKQKQTNVGAPEQKNLSEALSFATSGEEPKFAFNFTITDEDHPLVPLVLANQPLENTANHEALDNSLPTESLDVLQSSTLQKPELTQTISSAPGEDGGHFVLKIPIPESAPVTEKAAADGAAQKKKKKKKQKSSSNKKEIEETEISGKAKADTNGCQNKDASHQDETSQQSDDQLWKEVDWCVEQLELGLKTQKSSPKQVEEALRAIKTLRSDKAPLVKKRQIMRTMFGDYRKKMEEEQCKQLKLMQAAAKSARVVEVKENIRNKNCQVLRKRSGACRKSQESSGSPSASPRTSNTDAFRFTTSQEKFCFNFF